MATIRRLISLALMIELLIVSSARASAQSTILVPCKYPHGWNSTDAARDVNGTPAGYDHQCLFPFRPPDVIVVPCAVHGEFSSIDWSRVTLGTSLRVEYQCPPR
jgi:hypothetical protein